LRNLRPTQAHAAGNIWDAGTLEWLHNDAFGARSIPRVGSRYPLWDHPGLAQSVREARHFLPDAPTGRRETIMTSTLEAAPQYLLRVPGPGWTPFLSAVFTAAFFMLLTVKAVPLALACGALAVLLLLVWVWGNDPADAGPKDVGGGLELPTYAAGPGSHAWWATVIVLLVAGSLYLAFIFSYVYLWTVAPQGWTSAAQALPALTFPLASALLLAIAGACIWAADKTLARSRAGAAVLVIAALAALSAALTIEVGAHWRTGLRPDASAYAALVYLASALQLQIVAAVLIIGLFVLARLCTGRLHDGRRVTFEVLALLSYYASGQGLLGLLLVHGFPRTIA
jgi:cytochrome c oxidase subunit I+III